MGLGALAASLESDGAYSVASFYFTHRMQLTGTECADAAAVVQQYPKEVEYGKKICSYRCGRLYRAPAS